MLSSMVDFMGFIADLMGFIVDLMGFIADFMGFLDAVEIQHIQHSNTAIAVLHSAILTSVKNDCDIV